MIFTDSENCNNFRVRAAIRQTDPKHWKKLLAMRAGHSSRTTGSFYPAISPATLETLLLAADWKQYAHPAITEGCVAFTTPFPGFLGVVELEKLNPEFKVTLRKRQGNDNVVAVVSDLTTHRAEFSVIILGKGVDGAESVYAFHPGAPVRPGGIATTLSFGHKVQKVSATEAIAMGLRVARIGRTEPRIEQ